MLADIVTTHPSFPFIPAISSLFYHKQSLWWVPFQQLCAFSQACECFGKSGPSHYQHGYLIPLQRSHLHPVNCNILYFLDKNIIPNLYSVCGCRKSQYYPWLEKKHIVHRLRLDISVHKKHASFGHVK